MSDEKRVQQIRDAARYKYPDERIHFIDGAKWADSHPHWIPVEERKPQERGQVIQVIIMDYKKYSEELETIIAAINLPEHTRILVNGLMKAAKEQCKKGD